MTESLDDRVRRHVYTVFADEARAPTVADTAKALGAEEQAVRAAFDRLAEGRALVLQPDGELLMAEPFSAVPTPYLVEIGDKTYWGNCAWDALGILAMLRQDGRVLTACDDCGLELTLTVRGGELLEQEGVIHIVVPAKQWWDDIVYT